MIEYEKEPWAKEMHMLLTKMCREKSTLDASERQALYERYDEILQFGLAYHEKLSPLEKTGKRGRQKRQIGHNLLIRLTDHKSGTLRFLEDKEVPFTNNQAEQDLRMVKVKQKVSGCFRTMEGAKSFSMIRSYIGTAKKNDFNILDAIKKAFLTEVTLSDFFPQLTALSLINKQTI